MLVAKIPISIVNAQSGNLELLDRNLAIVLPLSGDAKAAVSEAWYRLSKHCGISYQSINGPNPHINLVAGRARELDTLVPKLQEIAAKFPPFEILALGLGVFLRETPVIHMRWAPGGTLRDLHGCILRSTEQEWLSRQSATESNMWLPKTTIALSDTSISNLPDAISSLNGINFDLLSIFTSLAIIEYGEFAEKTVFEVSLGPV